MEYCAAQDGCGSAQTRSGTLLLKITWILGYLYMQTELLAYFIHVAYLRIISLEAEVGGKWLIVGVSSSVVFNQLLCWHGLDERMGAKGRMNISSDY